MVSDKPELTDADKRYQEYINVLEKRVDQARSERDAIFEVACHLHTVVDYMGRSNATRTPETLINQLRASMKSSGASFSRKLKNSVRRLAGLPDE